MSHPTELPDLDRLEALAKAVKKGRDAADWEFAKAITPGTVLAILAALRAALARRAQPESEAPQAEPVAYLRWWARQIDEGHGNIGHEEGFEVCEPNELSDDGSPAFAVYDRMPRVVVPAAQHAESGAPSHETIVREGSNLVCTACGTSAPGTPEAPKELGLDIAVAVNQRISKYIAGNKPALMLLNEEELAALYRFQETCEDSDSGGYDVDKDMMKRLAAIGVIESKGFGRYQFTEFGDFVVERAAQLDGGQGEGK